MKNSPAKRGNSSLASPCHFSNGLNAIFSIKNPPSLTRKVKVKKMLQDKTLEAESHLI